VACIACVGVANEAWPVLECPVWPWPLCTRLKISISAMPALKAFSVLLILFVKWFSFSFLQEMISENTDNIANLPERIAIEEAKRLCPVQNDPHYKILDNQCFYFEQKSLNFDSANKNCPEKLGTSGRLYEPKSASEMKKVGQLGDDVFTSERYALLGITDKRIESQFAYSNGLPINFTPTWHSGFGSRGKGNDCVLMVMSSTDSDFTQWADVPCTSYYGSICQSNL